MFTYRKKSKSISMPLKTPNQMCSYLIDSSFFFPCLHFPMLSPARSPSLFTPNVGKHPHHHLRLADRTSSYLWSISCTLPFCQAVSNTLFLQSSITPNIHFSCGAALYWFIYVSFPAKWHLEARNLYYSTFDLEYLAQYVSMRVIQ